MKFDEVDTPDFVDLILEGGERGDEAMYYLLRQRLERQLRGKFEVYQKHLLDDFEDVVEDFFLYLREGNSHPSVLRTAPQDPFPPAGYSPSRGGELGGNSWSETPYQSLRRIRKKESFKAWLLNTFRNYLSVRSDAEKQIATAGTADVVGQADGTPPVRTDDSPLTDEHKLAVASNLIAYAHQTLYSRDRFIFLRTLLTLLNKQQALPNDEMARALGMTAIAYRVCVHRLKGKLSYIRTRLLRNERLPLDDTHRQMAQHINDDFTHLYPTIGRYYVLSIDDLKHAADVKRLREEYYASTGQMLHESETAYSLAPTISAFWTRLSRFLMV